MQHQAQKNTRVTSSADTLTAPYPTCTGSTSSSTRTDPHRSHHHSQRSYASNGSSDESFRTSSGEHKPTSATNAKTKTKGNSASSASIMDGNMSYHHEQFKMYKQRAEDDKKSRRRRQNNESSRRSRERKRLELETLQRAHISNQLKIAELESVVRHLSKELQKHDGALQAAMSSAPGSLRYAQRDQKDDRPGWFGSAF